MHEQIIETWQISNRINLYLLESIDEAFLSDKLGGKGRSVGEAFAHLHNVRLMWFKSADPELLPTVEKIEKTRSAKNAWPISCKKAARRWHPCSNAPSQKAA